MFTITVLTRFYRLTHVILTNPRRRCSKYSYLTNEEVEGYVTCSRSPSQLWDGASLAPEPMLYTDPHK